MNKNLQKALTEMDEVEFILLEHHMSIAKMARNIIKEFDVSPEDICAELGIKENQIKKVMNGSYEFDMMFLSKLQALWRKKEIERAEQKKIEVFAFPDYKYSRPIKDLIIEDLQKKIAELEKQLNHDQRTTAEGL